MANLQKGAASPPPSEPDKIKVRCLVEIYGSWRAPEARRGEVIEMTRAEYEKIAPGSFEDVAEVERKKAEAAKPVEDPWFVQQREALRADREASAKARAITARNQAEWAKRVADEAERMADPSKAEPKKG